MRDLRGALLSTLLIAAVVVSVAGALLAASDVEGDEVWGGGIIAGPAIATFIAVVALVRQAHDHLILQMVYRTVVFSLVVGLACAVAVVITSLLPYVTETVAATARPNGFHYWYGDEPHPFFLVLFAGWGLGVCAGLVAILLVVLIVAYRMPKVLADVNMTEIDGLTDASLASIRRTGIAFAWLLVLVFAVPTLIVWGSETASASDLAGAFVNLPGLLTDPWRYHGDALWVIGVLLVPLGIALLAFTAMTQRADRRRRAAAEVPLGLPVGESGSGPESERESEREYAAEPQNEPRPSQ